MPAVRKRASMAVLDSPVKPWNDNKGVLLKKLLSIYDIVFLLSNSEL